IRRNLITRNSGIMGGGGITIFGGADGYELAGNRICGNLSSWSGGGVSHFGRSDGGLIEANEIIFNEVFYGGNQGGNGGGLSVAGEPPVGDDPLGPGTGSVMINANLIQGNLAGSNNGGGISVLRANGMDVLTAGSPPMDWYTIDITNNIIANNTAAYTGGAISLQDAARVRIMHDTITGNDTTATGQAAFTTGAYDQSVPHVAGLAAYVHSPALLSAIGAGVDPEYAGFANPILENTILAHNRAFYWEADLNNGLGGLLPALGRYWDLGVLGGDGSERLDPRFCLLTAITEYHPSNQAGAAGFVADYSNDYLTAATIDEGGTFISVTLEPLTTLYGDYHLRDTSPVIDAGDAAGSAMVSRLQWDVDFEVRPSQGAPDIGADEFTHAARGFDGLGEPGGFTPITRNTSRIRLDEFGDSRLQPARSYPPQSISLNPISSVGGY
ncbi:hypothetical protein JW905_17980, partial [bacterium]|nr:hypothetical protein [candidate division CSSED10-310 bacterium]